MCAVDAQSQHRCGRKGVKSSVAQKPKHDCMRRLSKNNFESSWILHPCVVTDSDVFSSLKKAEWPREHVAVQFNVVSNSKVYLSLLQYYPLTKPFWTCDTHPPKSGNDRNRHNRSPNRRFKGCEYVHSASVSTNLWSYTLLLSSLDCVTLIRLKNDFVFRVIDHALSRSLHKPFASPSTSFYRECEWYLR